MKYMDMLPKLLKIAGKENFNIDSRIGKKYIFRQCWKYGWMLVRGQITAFANPNISGKIFRGKGVKLLEKRNMNISINVKLHDGVYIDALSTNGVKLKEGVILGRNTRIECTGSLSSIGKGIVIGKRSSFGNDCYFGTSGGIIIGTDVIAGQNVRFHSENHNFDSLDMLIREQGIRRQGIQVGNNCWIGAGAVFLDGAELGNGCVVAANAVVTEVFPPNSVIAGVPARLIRKRGNQDGR